MSWCYTKWVGVCMIHLAHSWSLNHQHAIAPFQCLRNKDWISFKPSKCWLFRRFRHHDETPLLSTEKEAAEEVPMAKFKAATSTSKLWAAIVAWKRDGSGTSAKYLHLKLLEIQNQPVKDCLLDCQGSIESSKVRSHSPPLQPPPRVAEANCVIIFMSNRQPKWWKRCLASDHSHLKLTRFGGSL